MAEKPILFSGEMVKAILEGRKTKTRRVIKPQPVGANCVHEWKDGRWEFGQCHDNGTGEMIGKPVVCPYGQPGDTLWVRETWRVGAWSEDGICVDYRADNYCRKEWLKVPDEEVFERLWADSTDDAIKAGLEPDESSMYWWRPGQAPTRWRPSIFIPRWASRITLRVIDVRAERLQDISEEDAIVEGLTSLEQHGATYYGLNRADVWETDPRLTFKRLWDSINAGRGFGWDANPWVWVVSFESMTNLSAKMKG